MSNEYPEIEALNQLWVKHKVMVKTDRSKLLDGKSYYPSVEFTLGNRTFQLFVDDEYDDLKKNYPLLNFCLVLRELEGYEYSENYQQWCQERFFEPEVAAINEAYEQLALVYKEVKEILGEIDSKISDYDFELNAGAAQAIRKETY